VPNPNVLRVSALRAADRLPLLSVVLNRALGLLSQGDDVSVKDLSTVIEEDVVITGSLLSIANSALYCRNSRVASVRPAISRLGFRKTRNVLLGLTVSRCFTSVRVPGPWSSIRFNAHSLAVATLSDLIVQSVPSENAEWAFMAGLLHDIGLPLIAVGLPEQYRAITMQAGSDEEIAEREREVLGFTHFDLGAEMLARWNCPPMVQEATRFGDSIEVLPSERPLHLGAVVKAASQVADASGISIFGSSEDGNLATQVLDALEIPAPQDFIAMFRAEYNNVQAGAA
jgi:putative nucleotidyltransferase with HDIG domain